MAERRVKVVFSAEVQNYKAAMEAAAKSTEAVKKAAEDAGKATEQNGKKSEQSSQRSSTEITRLAAAHQMAAAAAGLQYNNTGQLVTMNGKALSSQQAAAHGLQSFSEEAYLAGQAAAKAGEESAAGAEAAAEAAAKHKESLERVGAAAAVTGAAILAGVGLAVKSYADFDKQMSAVDAATHETAGNMDLLRQAAIDAGADTAFSAGEAAQGIEQMAKAGVSTKDILGGGLTGALSLAAAGSLDVGKAAEIAASAMTQFKLSGDKLPHVADLLAAGAGKAQGSVEDLGAALNQSGLVAAQTGLTIEETTGGLAAFASAGLVGSDAGTSFKAMLQRLNPQSKEAAELMADLGLSAYDSQGNFIGLSEYAGELQTALGGMTTEQRNATLSTLFGSDAIRAASVLYENGAAGVEKWESAVNDAGYAAETAARMQDNLAGDLEKLGGSFDTVLIQSGSGANDVLRGLVQGLEGLVDAVGKVPGPVLGVATGLAAVVGGAGLVGGALITIIPKIKDTKDALNDLAPAGGKARNALEKVGKAAGVAAGLAAVTTVLAKMAEADYMSKIDVGMGRVALALADVATNGPGAKKALDDLFKDRDGGDLINTVTDLESAIKRTFNRDGGQQFNDWGESIVNGMTGVKGSSQMLGEQFERLDAGLSDLVSSGKSDDAAKSFDKIKEAAKNQGVSVEELVKKFPQYADALKQAEADGKNAGKGGDAAAAGIKAAGDAAATAGPSADDLAKALEDVGVNADGSIADLDKFAEALSRAGLLNLSARDAARGFEEAIDAVGESIKTNGTTMDIGTEKGRANQAALDAVAKAGFSVVEANAANGASQEALQGNLSTTYESLITSAGQFGITGQAAIDLAREVLKVPAGVNIDTWMDSEAKRMAEETKVAVDAITPRKVVTVVFQTDASGFYDPSAGTDGKGTGSGGKMKAPGVYATGGRLPGYADGGQLPTSGPGTGMTDGFLGISSAGVPLARVDAGEWIINRGSSGRYNRELAAINAGTFPKLPGYATGGMFAAGSFAGSAGGGAVTVSAPAVTVMIGNEQLDARTYRVATAAISSADSQSQFSRRGR